MQPGSLVICIETVDEGTLLNLLLAAMRIETPVKGSIYVVEDVERCGCGKHDNLYLEEIPNKGWPDKYFREIQPPVNVAELIEEMDTELV